MAHHHLPDDYDYSKHFVPFGAGEGPIIVDYNGAPLIIDANASKRTLQKVQSLHPGLIQMIRSNNTKDVPQEVLEMFDQFEDDEDDLDIDPEIDALLDDPNIEEHILDLNSEPLEDETFDDFDFIVKHAGGVVKDETPDFGEYDETRYSFFGGIIPPRILNSTSTEPNYDPEISALTSLTSHKKHNITSHPDDDQYEHSEHSGYSEHSERSGPGEDFDTIHLSASTLPIRTQRAEDRPEPFRDIDQQYEMYFKHHYGADRIGDLEEQMMDHQANNFEYDLGNLDDFDDQEIDDIYENLDVDENGISIVKMDNDSSDPTKITDINNDNESGPSVFLEPSSVRLLASVEDSSLTSLGDPNTFVEHDDNHSDNKNEEISLSNVQNTTTEPVTWDDLPFNVHFHPKDTPGEDPDDIDELEDRFLSQAQFAPQGGMFVSDIQNTIDEFIGSELALKTKSRRTTRRVRLIPDTSKLKLIHKSERVDADPLALLSSDDEDEASSKKLRFEPYAKDVLLPTPDNVVEAIAQIVAEQREKGSDTEPSDEEPSEWKPSDDWDIETLASEFSTVADNLPNLITLPKHSKRVHVPKTPLIELSHLGIPKNVIGSHIRQAKDNLDNISPGKDNNAYGDFEDVSEDSDNENEEEFGGELTNLGQARPPEESLEAKRLRKAQVRKQKQKARIQKKAIRKQYKTEYMRQTKQNNQNVNGIRFK